MKKVILGVIVGVLISSGLVYASEVFNLVKVDYPIKINGQVANFELPILNYEGNTYIPLRKVSEATGSIVAWNNVKRTIEIVNEKKIEYKQISRLEDLPLVLRNKLRDDVKVEVTKEIRNEVYKQVEQEVKNKIDSNLTYKYVNDGNFEGIQKKGSNGKWYDYLGKYSHANTIQIGYFTEDGAMDGLGVYKRDDTLLAGLHISGNLYDGMAMKKSLVGFTFTEIHNNKSSGNSLFINNTGAVLVDSINYTNNTGKKYIIDDRGMLAKTVMNDIVLKSDLYEKTYSE